MCYTAIVQTSFYASGFLYSRKTHQILLLTPQPDNTHALWSTFRGEGSEGEEAQATFQRIINELFSLELKTKDIYPVYDYFHDTEEKINFVFYAEVKNPQILNNLKDDTCSWVDFHEVAKLPFALHSKQDVIVGERVISAKRRDNEAKRILPS